MGASNIVNLGAVPDFQNDGLSEAAINASSNGANTIVAGVAGKRISVFGLHLFAAASVALTVQDVSGTATVTLTGAMTFLPGQPLVLPYQQYPWYTCAPGDALVFSTNAGVQLSGRLIYMQ